MHTDKVIESRPIDGYKHATIDCALPPGVTDIKSTVWFGKVKNSKNRTTGFKRNMMKGIRTVAATFLLEAMVLLVAGATWQGPWSQRVYDTGITDAWELFATHTTVT